MFNVSSVKRTGEYMYIYCYVFTDFLFDLYFKLIFPCHLFAPCIFIVIYVGNFEFVMKYRKIDNA